MPVPFCDECQKILNFIEKGDRHFWNEIPENSEYILIMNKITKNILTKKQWCDNISSTNKTDWTIKWKG